MLFQAGASAKGLAFATHHAEAIFIGGGEKSAIKRQVETIRQLAKAQGRNPNDIKVLMGITVVTDKRHDLAQAKLAEYEGYASSEAGLAHYSSSVGIDLSQYADDEVIAYQQTNSIASVNQRFRQQVTKAQLIAEHRLGGRYPLIVGDGREVAEALITWVDETGIDGFNVTRTVTPESYEDFIQYVIPELQRRGRFKTEYKQGSLRHKLIGKGERLPSSHPVQSFRC